MDPAARERLYERLGFERPTATPALQGIATPGRFPREDESPPPLSLEDIDQLERELANEPDETLARIRRGWDATASEADVRRLLERTRAALQRPASALATLDALRPFDAELRAQLPPAFDFPGKTSEIPIDPGNYRFETERDALGWAIHAGPLWLKSRYRPEKVDFRWAEDFPAPHFVYGMPEDERPITIALMSDFGTGLYHSRYIARQVGAARPDYVFHLGDVYYAGKAAEFAERFTPVLAPLLATARVFVLNANHEMLSGGRYYFEYLDQKRRTPGVLQEQEGSYFCICSERFQIIGIDTAYHMDSRHEERRLQEWLRARLEEGKEAHRTNILLSPNEPYELGKPGLKPLYAVDLGEFAARGLIDLWFWGNTHYGALFERSAATPFIGSCIGHGGYPYSRTRDADRQGTPTAVRFLETGARFPAWTEVRQDRGNNGFVLMTLHPDGEIQLDYIDWTRTLRHRATLAPVPGESYVDFTGPPEPLSEPVGPPVRQDHLAETPPSGRA
jgi:hypothetical protein